MAQGDPVGKERLARASTVAGRRSSPTTCSAPRRRAGGESVEQIQPDLVIPTGKRKGLKPSVASIYRAIAEHAKGEVYPKPSNRPTPNSLPSRAARSPDPPRYP
ncbi:hypothetical protein [Streptomyces sp. FXY-T5]|uniref:hypothetical protein n=1 Tax=Streptomyces sp. FXY-T5 TaxID=3064901 RepID=UPI0027D2F436|nr:hypothetical protein [Streptomyces sp. FXY-T5]WMD06333.1 hypothetical protein Q7C01_18855 [Streptomyces sp. FXY-T5]